MASFAFCVCANVSFAHVCRFVSVSSCEFISVLLLFLSLGLRAWIFVCGAEVIEVRLFGGLFICALCL